MTVHVIGASGRTGAALCRSLLADGVPFVPVVRSVARWAATGLPGTPVVADLGDMPVLEAERVVSCAHARHAGAVLAATPGARIVLLGSTRRFTSWPDAHGDGVIAGEAALRNSGRAGIILHPTMIYGAEGEDNVQRLAALLRRLPVVPLPGGGRALVQPIHQSDVTRCVRAALDIAWTGPTSLVIAGPAALPYAEFVRAVARAAGLRPARILDVPASLLRALCPITRLPGLPSVGANEIRRLTEDKAFDIAPMLAQLGVQPVPLDRGLALTFGDRPCPS